MSSAPPVKDCSVLQGQGPIDHLHPECPVCGRPDPSCREQDQILDALDRACTRWGMRISGDKTKVLSIGEPPGPPSHHTERPGT